MVPWNLRKRHILLVNENLSSVYFSLPKFQRVSCNLSLAMIWQITYTHKLPVLCSATLIGACHGKSYRIHSSSTDQRIRNPVSWNPESKTVLDYKGRGIKYCLADQKYWAIKMILFKFQIRLVFPVKFKQTTWRA